LLLLYVLWQIIFDRHTPKKGGRMIPWLRRLHVWKLAAEYFPARLHTPHAPYQNGKPHIFCLHPHGIISIAAVANLVWEASSASERVGVEYRVATVSFNFMLPVWRDIIMGLGFVDASRESVEYLLKHDKSVMIVIGGAREALYANPGSTELVLKDRQGFVKLALKHGASLVPVFHFGENELYTQARSPFVRRMQELAIKLTGFTIPLFNGRGIINYDYGKYHIRPVLLGYESCDMFTERLAKLQASYRIEFHWIP
jgi:2-acylglycerol O-acyltransferase 2